ncbi:MAG: EamA family transporter [Pseudomonadota bacterium]
MLPIRHTAMGVAVAATWGMGIVFAKAGIEHFPPILLMSFRFAVTAAVLLWFVPRPVGQLRAIFGITVIASAIQYSLTFSGLKGLDASITALVVQLEVPFLVLLGAVFLREHSSFRKWAGIAVAFVGVAIIADQPQLGGAWGSLALVVGGAFCWAVGQVLIRSLSQIDGLTLTAWMALFASVQLAVMSLVFEDNHIQAVIEATPVVWLAVLYLGLVMTALGYGLWNSLIRTYPVSRVAPLLLLLPVFALLGGVIFLGERLSLHTAIGGVLVLAAVAAIELEPNKTVQHDT